MNQNSQTWLSKSARVFSLLLIMALLLPFQSSFARPISFSNNPDQISSLTPSNFPEKPPVIDGLVSSQEWASATLMPLNIGGALMVMNDYVNIYFLIDVTADTYEDPLTTSPSDYFWLTFDVNQNGIIDAYVDLLFSFYPNSETPCVEKYTGPGTFTGCSLPNSTYKPGFGVTLQLEHTAPLLRSSHQPGRDQLFCGN